MLVVHCIFEDYAKDWVGGYDGTVNGAVLDVGKFGRAYKFDDRASQRIYIDNNIPVKFCDCSFLFWCRIEDFASADKDIIVNGYSHASHQPLLIWFDAAALPGI